MDIRAEFCELGQISSTCSQQHRDLRLRRANRRQKNWFPVQQRDCFRRKAWCSFTRQISSGHASVFAEEGQPESASTVAASWAISEQARTVAASSLCPTRAELPEARKCFSQKRP